MARTYGEPAVNGEKRKRKDYWNNIEPMELIWGATLRRGQFEWPANSVD